MLWPRSAATARANMADSEFEQFRLYLEKFPCANSSVKAATQDIYSLVHDIDLDAESPDSPKSDDDVSPKEHLDGVPNGAVDVSRSASSVWRGEETSTPTPSATTDLDGFPKTPTPTPTVWRGSEATPIPDNLVDSAVHRPERRRRRLPEIPKNKKSSVLTMTRQASASSHPPSLAEEMQQALQFAIGGQARPMLVLKCSHGYLRDEDSSPDSERFLSSEVDSGHSTAHSPDASPPPAQCFSPVSSSGSSSGGGGGGGGVPFRQLEMLEATHRGLHKFVPRHHDEIDVEIGDPIYVQKEADDLWCEGVNLRSGRQGIFPSAYAVDTDYSDFDPATPKVKRERYLLGYLGSVETSSHKGTSVLSQAVRKMTAQSGGRKPHSCILEVSDQGLRMSDKRPRPNAKDSPCLDYFYSLKNVSFCAFHPRDHRYMGFITKHPTLQRFACHVFLGQESTRPVAEAIGRAFQRFYTKYIETAFPIEDIYIE